MNNPLSKVSKDNSTTEYKVLYLLEAKFDLVLGSSLHMKIQIMGGIITENLGLKSLPRKVKKGV